VALLLEAAEWAAEQFGGCQFGHRARTKRMVKFATQAAASPEAATPQQAETWSDCKAAYRLFNRDRVTFDAVAEPHRVLTREALRGGKFLILSDTTEICFGCHRALTGVGRVGTIDEAQGFFLHSALAVAAGGPEVIGVAGQDLYARPLERIKRLSSKRRKQELTRESAVWGRVIDRVGPPPVGTTFIHVCDRGADDFEVYCHLLEQQADWVIRASHLTRLVIDAEDERRSLQALLQDLPSLGDYELSVPANRDQPERVAKLEVRCTSLKMPRPQSGVTDYVKRRGVTDIPMWAIEVLEPNPPTDAKPLHWVLLTSLPIHTFEEAYAAIGFYEQRQVIEEYHKCLKTGCRVEERKYRTGAALEPVIAFQSVMAVRLLQLKIISRLQPDLPAEKVVPRSWLLIMPLVSKRKQPIRTVRDFFRRLAGLGGFLGRKHDGEPGWQTIWRGLEKLLLTVRGVEAYREKYG
jgi:hypothetical protein